MKKGMHQRASVSAMLLLIAALLVGCSSEDGNKAETASKAGESAAKADPFADAPSVEVADLQSGLALLNDMVKSFKQSVESDDAGSLTELTGQMSGVWVKIGTEVKSGNPQLFESVNDLLAKLAEQARSDKPDRDALIEQSYSLYQQIRDARKQLQVQ
ncbi:hypothetical protein ACFPVX_02355 [Cohnella faecalis]|uniref:DUF4363 family protein n=1 Tax=Cohnella faecalis TaxID=2315694 RepID=A0A398D047_9BACL|nr:hypothetical protein [Cohnella faecalis]RIE04841.1 hypothetical protein D3H35_05080 [Cohnella faecalis]